MKFSVACKRFFGLKSNQTLKEFAAELRALTQEDKAELADLLSAEFEETVEI